MNVLNFTTSDLNGLTFDLLVDGQPLAELVGTDTVGLPYYYLEKGLKPYELQGEDYYIVTCCDCGHAGCGSVVCKVTEDEEFVTFHDFRFCQSSPILKFSVANFKQVMTEIAAHTTVEEEQQQKLDDEDAKQSLEDARHNRLVVAEYVKAVANLLATPDIAEQIAKEIQIPKFTAHEVAKWLTTETAYKLIRNLVPDELRLFRNCVIADPRITNAIPFDFGLYVYGDDKAINLICAGYGDSRMDIVENFVIRAPIPSPDQNSA